MGNKGPFEGIEGAERAKALLDRGCQLSAENPDKVYTYLFLTDGFYVEGREIVNDFCCDTHAIMNAVLEFKRWREWVDEGSKKAPLPIKPCMVVMRSTQVIFARGFGKNDVNTHITEEEVLALQEAQEARYGSPSRQLH
jgi:hypothetical protein